MNAISSLSILFDWEVEHELLGGGIDACIQLDDLFRVIVLLLLLLLPLPGPEALDAVALVTASHNAGRRMLSGSLPYIPDSIHRTQYIELTSRHGKLAVFIYIRSI